MRGPYFRPNTPAHPAQSENYLKGTVSQVMPPGRFHHHNIRNITLPRLMASVASRLCISTYTGSRDDGSPRPDNRPKAHRNRLRHLHNGKLWALPMRDSSHKASETQGRVGGGSRPTPHPRRNRGVVGAHDEPHDPGDITPSRRRPGQHRDRPGRAARWRRARSRRRCRSTVPPSRPRKAARSSPPGWIHLPP